MKKEEAAKPLPIGVVPNPKAKLLDQVREVIMARSDHPSSIQPQRDCGPDELHAPQAQQGCNHYRVDPGKSGSAKENAENPKRCRLSRSRLGADPVVTLVFGTEVNER